MNDKSRGQDSFRALQLMAELEAAETISQRELASRLGIAVGLVNSYLKNFVAKGYVRIKNYPRNRYAYLLTPKGLVEKSRLAYQHISYFTSLYTITRSDYTEIFRELAAKDVKKVYFAGVDEFAEIAYLSLQEVGSQLMSIHDNHAVGQSFLGFDVQPIELKTKGVWVVTTLKKRDEIIGDLIRIGVQPEFIFSLKGHRHEG